MRPSPAAIGHADCVRDANNAGINVFVIIDKPILLRAPKRFVEQKLTD
jgi:hypothetical protein